MNTNIEYLGIEDALCAFLDQQYAIMFETVFITVRIPNGFILRTTMFPVTDIYGHHIRCGILPQNLMKKFLEKISMETIVILMKANYGYASHFYSSHGIAQEEVAEHFYNVAQEWLNYGIKAFPLMKKTYKGKTLKDACSIARFPAKNARW